MGCGCGKGRGGPLPQVEHMTSSGPTTARVAVYEVVAKGGGASVLLSTTNPVAARQEAKRLGASVRVTSRPVEQAELQTLAG